MAVAQTAASRMGSVPNPASVLRDGLEAGLHYLNERLADKTQHWVEKLDEHEATQGSAEQAAYRGGKAELQGRNPVWPAVKGAWAGASANTKVAAVLILLLLVVLAPVPTVLLILGVLIAALIDAIRKPAKA